MSTTGLTLDLLRRSGYLAESVERWIPKVNRRRDLFSIGDVLAIHPYRKPGFVLVQCTSHGHVGDRLTKAKSKPALRAWLAAGGAFEVWGWSQRGGRWEVKRVSVAAADLAETIIEQPPRRTKCGAERELFT